MYLTKLLQNSETISERFEELSGQTAEESWNLAKTLQRHLVMKTCNWSPKQQMFQDQP